jgi:serine/threonine-protein kinase
MEYINGPSLRKLIEREGYLNLNEAVFFFRHMLMAVRELHRSKDKTIHRDLKPENFLLSKDLTYIKVIDYGISTTFYSKTRGYTKKIVGDEDQIYGTYPYISPDILLMKDAVTEDDKIKIITEQFDFFSLGVIFYEMLIGEKPFYSDNYDDVKVIKLPLTYDMLCLNDLDPNIPNGIENIIFRCMASKKEDKHFRYNTIEEIISDLDKYRSDPSASFNEKLLKPKSMRVFQTKVLFNVQKEKDKQGLFEQLW